jgi:hypothetical protein
MDHEIDAVILDANVKTAGYQGTPAPDQWFGGPSLSSRGGNMVLRDSKGNVVDGLNYGLHVDPWAGEGYHAVSGAGASGCFVAVPVAARGGRMAVVAPTVQPDRSAGRFPDGKDSDSNCSDFRLQSAVSISVPSLKGANNIKVSSVADFVAGQKIIIGTGADGETAVISAVGTSGGTATGVTSRAGAKTIIVSGIEGINAGQTISIGSGANLETAVVSAVAPGRRGPGGPGGAAPPTPTDTIKLASPMRFAHAAGSQVAGSGITLASPLNNSHNAGTPVAANLPTPGGPNKFAIKP